ncbi:hypothetical protein ElyMa_007055200 [Elysia marginata]|uniref:Ion transport domain-containing protein n=1 Tax=Elysia marginata TaxID=1093978 RepID=A0AAV4JYN4_9GAST|nr:hypothetical protein ElyMa_007055200 [Elysia marginata]
MPRSSRECLEGAVSCFAIISAVVFFFDMKAILDWSPRWRRPDNKITLSEFFGAVDFLLDLLSWLIMSKRLC